MATDTQDQQVIDRPGQTAPVPLPAELQPDQSATHTMLNADGSQESEVPVAHMSAARSVGGHVAIPMQAPDPDNRTGLVPLHRVTEAVKAGYKHIGAYKKAIDSALDSVRDKRNDLAIAATDAITKHVPNFDLMPPEIQNDLKNMVGMGVGFYTGGVMQPGMSSEEAKASTDINHPLTSTIPPVGLGDVEIEPSEPAQQLGRVPVKPNLNRPALPSGETGPRTIDVEATAPGKYEPKATPAAPAEAEEPAKPKAESPVAASAAKAETGKPVTIDYLHNEEKAPDMGERFGQHIEPAGKYVIEDELKDHPAPKNWTKGQVTFQNPLVLDWGEGYQSGKNWKNVLSQQYDGKTGSELSQAVKADGHDGIITRDAGGTREIVDLTGVKPEEIITNERQSALKEPYKVEIADTDARGNIINRQTVPIEAFSSKNAIAVAKKQYPNAGGWSIESFGERTPSTEYSVPNGKHLSMPESMSGKTVEDTIHHELGHAMIGLKEDIGMIPEGVIRHTHPSSDSTTRAAVLWKVPGLYQYGPRGRTVAPEKLPGLVRNFLGGIAQDEIRGLPRDKNINFDAKLRTSDGERAFSILRAAGVAPDRAMEIMHQAIDESKKYLTDPAVSSVINENAPFREPGLSNQFHFSAERLNNMHAEVQRRISNAERSAVEAKQGKLFDNGAADAGNTLGRAADVRAGQSESTPVAGQSVPAQTAVPVVTGGDSIPSTDGLSEKAQGYAKAVLRISRMAGKDAAITSGRGIAGNAQGPEGQQLHDWLDKWESTVSTNELNQRLTAMKDSPLNVIGSGESVVPSRDFTKARQKTLLQVGADAKTVKGEKIGVMTGILYLAPDTTSGIANTCPFATEGCRQACLFTAGRAGIFPAINTRRIERTEQFKFDRPAFMQQLSKKIASIVRAADKQGFKPAIRLNGTSDIPWENVKTAEGKTLMEAYPNVQFYDYTKNPSRMAQYTKGELPANYHLTFSRSETNDAQTIQILKDGGNAAVVFNTKKGYALPKEWNGFNVIDGDESDVRFIDGKSQVIGLRAKGKAKKDTSGFVLKVEPGEKLAAKK